jgi:hypothetical protein
MNYIMRFTQDGREYKEEITEEQFRFYTSKNYQADPLNPPEFLPINENPLPEIDEDVEYIQTQLVVTETTATRSHSIIPYTSEELEKRKVEKALSARKKAEAEATVTYKGVTFKANDQAITLLSTYLSLSAGSVVWKGLDNQWLMASKEDMTEMLTLVIEVRKSLFEKEFQDTQ